MSFKEFFFSLYEKSVQLDHKLANKLIPTFFKQLQGLVPSKADTWKEMESEWLESASDVRDFLSLS